MIKKIIYIISVISLILLSILTFQMLPIIFQTKWQGLLFLVSVIGILVFELIFYIFNRKMLKKATSYNMFLILITMYLSIVYYRIYSTVIDSHISLNINYCKTNYLIISISIMIIIYNVSYLYKETNKKEN